VALLVTLDSSMQSDAPLSSAERTRVYRQRLRANGGEEVVFKLPTEIVALLDKLKERHGLRNRSQALMQLIEYGRATAQQMT
jgi:transposase